MIYAGPAQMVGKLMGFYAVSKLLQFIKIIANKRICASNRKRYAVHDQRIVRTHRIEPYYGFPPGTM